MTRKALSPSQASPDRFASLKTHPQGRCGLLPVTPQPWLIVKSAQVVSR